MSQTWAFPLVYKQTLTNTSPRSVLLHYTLSTPVLISLPEAIPPPLSPAKPLKDERSSLRER